jgi:N-acyl-D-amino-acid deacylase
MRPVLTILLIISLFSCNRQEYDVILRGGTVYDGSGEMPAVADVAIQADTIAFVGDLSNAVGKKEIDVKGLAVAPGFINMLSWAVESLIIDGNAESDIRQGVTLEVFGEGSSMGPINDAMKADARDAMRRDPDWKYDIDWTTLGEYLESMERRGVSPNIASFVGATSVRVHEIGYANRAPTMVELDRMRALVRTAMEEGRHAAPSSPA